MDILKKRIFSEQVACSVNVTVFIQILPFSRSSSRLFLSNNSKFSFLLLIFSQFFVRQVFFKVELDFISIFETVNLKIILI